MFFYRQTMPLQIGVDLVELGFVRVVALKAEASPQLLDHRMKCAVLIEGRTETQDPVVRFALQPVPQIAADPRFSQPRFRRKQNDLALAVLGLFPTAEQKADFFISANQWREAGLRCRLEPVACLGRFTHAIGRDRRRDTFDGLRPQIIENEHAFGETAGSGANNDGSGFRQSLEAGRKVGRFTKDRVFLGCALADDVSGHHQARRDADANFQFFPARGISPGESFNNVKTREDGPLGIIFTGSGIPEINQQTVAHIARDISLIALNGVDTGLLEFRNMISKFLGIDAFSKCCGTDKIAKHDR